MYELTSFLQIHFYLQNVANQARAFSVTEFGANGQYAPKMHLNLVHIDIPKDTKILFCQIWSFWGRFQTSFSENTWILCQIYWKFNSLNYKLWNSL